MHRQVSEDYYGDLYTTADALRLLSAVGIVQEVAGNVISDQLTRWGTRASRSNLNWSGSLGGPSPGEAYAIGRRQAATITQFGRFNAAMGVIGFGAAGFQLGAYGMALLSCTP